MDRVPGVTAEFPPPLILGLSKDVRRKPG